MTIARAFQILIFIFLLLNITFSANNWFVGIVFYFIALVIGSFVLINSKYLFSSILIICLVVLTQVLEAISPDLGFLKNISTSVFFVMVGMTLYGGEFIFLRKYLVIFVLLNIPIMFIQMIGLHEAFMYWVTDFAHDVSVLSIPEIGTFKKMPIYPTLFLSVEELVYSSPQGRPAGLLPNNNILSVLLAFAFVINMYCRPKKTGFGYDLILCIAVTMVMSKLVFLIALITLLYTFFFSDFLLSRVALKQSLYFLICFSIYALLFPGLFSANFSDATIAVSFFIRILGISNALGLDSSLFIGAETAQLYGILTDADGPYQHPIAILLSSKYLLFGAILALSVFYPRLKKALVRIETQDLRVYQLSMVLGVSIVLSMLTMPMFLNMHLFMIVVGSLFNYERVGR